MSQTTTPSETPIKTPVLAARRKSNSRGFFAASFLRFFHDKLSMFALAIFVIVTFLSYNAEWIAKNILKQDRDTIDLELVASGTALPAPPGTGGHILGTDDAGRDLLVRLLYGGQVSLSVGFLTAFIAVFIGTILGLISGYFGGFLDDGVNGLVQIILNIPSLFLLIILSLIWQPSILSLSIIIGLLSWVGTTRLVRGSVLTLRTRDYVDAARVLGAGNTRILFVHILPNVVSVMLVQAGFDIVSAMLGESGLSFLGFGIGVPIPSWGNMLSDSQAYFTSAPWMVYAPAVAFFITVLCVYLVADGLRDAFDPRLIDKG